MTRTSFHHHGLGAMLIVLATATAAAQTGGAARYVDEARGLTIEALVERALDQSPAARAAHARVDAAKGELAQAALRPNPTASVEWRDEVAGPDSQLMIGLAWPLDVSRQTGRTAVAQQQVTAGTLRQADGERLLAAAVRRQAVRLLAAVRHLELRERMRTAAQNTRDLLAARAESGAGTPLDRDVAEVELRRADAAVLRQRAEADAALADLKALVGVPPGETLLLRERLDALAAGPVAGLGQPAGQAPEAAIEARPDVRAADTEVALTAAQADLLKRETKPDVSLTGSYWRMDAGFPQLGVNTAGQLAPIHGLFHSVSIGATVSLPWRNRQQGAIAAIEAAGAAARYDRDALRLEAAAEIEVARARETLARQAWEIYAGGLRDLAARNLEVVRESYRLGRATLVEVLAETRRYLDIETSGTEVLRDLLEARIALAKAMGVIR